MREYLLLDEIKLFTEWAFKYLNEQKKSYSFEQIEKLEKKLYKKYMSIMNLTADRMYRNYTKWRALSYIKAIMQLTGANNTSEIDITEDIDELSIKLLEATDKLGYEKYLEKQNKNTRK